MLGFLETPGGGVLKMQTAEITYRVITLTYILISEGELSTQIVKEIFSMKCQNYGHNPMLIHRGARPRGGQIALLIFFVSAI